MLYRKKSQNLQEEDMQFTEITPTFRPLPRSFVNIGIVFLNAWICEVNIFFIHLNH